MWSDPIDEVIAQFGRLLEEHKEQLGGDWTILKNVHLRAERHRKLENETGKVGFEATNG